MMYSEFVQGTGCRDNEKNYKIYKDLEVMYMNSDISKEEIYQYGMKLVDNSKPQEIIDVENRMQEKIREQQAYIDGYKKEIERYQTMLAIETEDEWIKEWKRMIKIYRNYIKQAKDMIKRFQWVME